MIKCSLSLLIIATCIVSIFADEFYEKQKKLDSECAKYCYQVAKPLLLMAPVCHKKDEEINELNIKIAKLVVYEEREKKCLAEVKLCKDLNVVYGERERKNLEEQNKYNELNDKFLKLHEKLAVYEDRDRKSLETENKYNELKDKLNELSKKLAVYECREKGIAEANIELKTKIANLQNDLGFYKERERKSLEEGNMCNELNATLAELPRILLNLQDREKKGIEEMNKSKQLNVQLGEVQEKLADCEEREKKGIEEINLNKKVNVQLGEVQGKLVNCEERENKSKEIYSKTESSFKESLEEYRVRLLKLASSNLALNISNQKLKEDLGKFNNYPKYNNTCLLGSDTTGFVKIEGMKTISVYCVNNLNSGPGWIKIQMKNDKRAHEFLYYPWSEYRNGFDNFDGHFFIGLENLYRLTNAVPHELYIDMEDWYGNKKFAHYDNFRVGDESEQYPLKDLGNYTGNAGDALRDNNNMKFSTKDRDNDNSPDIDCADKHYSGWWHNNCTKANPNGWQSGRNKYIEDGIWWFSHVPLKKVRMQIRPKVKK